MLKGRIEPTGLQSLWQIWQELRAMSTATGLSPEAGAYMQTGDQATAEQPPVFLHIPRSQSFASVFTWLPGRLLVRRAYVKLAELALAGIHRPI